MKIILILFFALITFSYHQLWSQESSIVLLKRTNPVDENACKNCHLQREEKTRNTVKKLERKHQEKENLHGKIQLACGNCHDRQRFNLLKYSIVDERVSFVNSSPVCQQCHGRIFKDWQQGIHGKRIGGWDLQKVQLQCVDCHDSHSVSFPKMKAEPPPVRPHLK